ncbi:hypothetical protein ACLB0R_10795 [Sphingomonas sp. GlSt437]|uniref:hypothetical protein n=1 Tax=Sphingomonas sp. GlSt437 TaxID=3389970 RepID=UPI003A871479
MRQGIVLDLKSAVAALAALAHEGRLVTFRMLVQARRDGIAPGEIARRSNTAPNTLSSNLSILAHARLIDSR